MCLAGGKDCSQRNCLRLVNAFHEKDTFVSLYVCVSIYVCSPFNCGAGVPHLAGLFILESRIFTIVVSESISCFETSIYPLKGNSYSTLLWQISQGSTEISAMWLYFLLKAAYQSYCGSCFWLKSSATIVVSEPPFCLQRMNRPFVFSCWVSSNLERI